MYLNRIGSKLYLVQNDLVLLFAKEIFYQLQTFGDINNRKITIDTYF